MVARRIVAVAAATVIAFLAVEAGLRLFAPQSLNRPFLSTSFRGYAENRRSTTVGDSMPGRSVRYRLNSLGFRGGEPGNGRRILIVGDSVTFGMLLDEADTYVSRLASSAIAEFGAGRFSFMNAAVAGWGAADYVAFVEDRGDEFRPDAVLVFVGFDDVRRAWRSQLWDVASDDAITRRPLPELRRRIRLSGYSSYRFVIEHSHAAQLMRRVAIGTVADSKDSPLSADDARAALALTRKLFTRLSEWCRSRGVALLVTNGTLLEYSGESAADNPTVTFFEDADAFFSQLGAPYLAVAKAHGPLSEPLASLIIPDDGHPNERGAAVIFEAVQPWLLDQLRDLLERPSPGFRSQPQ